MHVCVNVQTLHSLKLVVSLTASNVQQTHNIQISLFLSVSHTQAIVPLCSGMDVLNLHWGLSSVCVCVCVCVCVSVHLDKADPSLPAAS